MSVNNRLPCRVRQSIHDEEKEKRIWHLFGAGHGEQGYPKDPDEREHPDRIDILISGIALGILASQALTMITGKIAGIALTGFTFVFSINSLIAAVLFFGVTFFFVHLFNIREMKKLN